MGALSCREIFFTTNVEADQKFASLWPVSGQAEADCKRFVSHDSKEKRVLTRQDKTQFS
jgi:hypothetical protein